MQGVGDLKWAAIETNLDRVKSSTCLPPGISNSTHFSLEQIELLLYLIPGGLRQGGHFEQVVALRFERNVRLIKSWEVGDSG